MKPVFVSPIIIDNSPVFDIFIQPRCPQIGGPQITCDRIFAANYQIAAVLDKIYPKPFLPAQLNFSRPKVT